MIFSPLQFEYTIQTRIHFVKTCKKNNWLIYSWLAFHTTFYPWQTESQQRKKEIVANCKISFMLSRAHRSFFFFNLYVYVFPFFVKFQISHTSIELRFVDDLRYTFNFEFLIFPTSSFLLKKKTTINTNTPLIFERKKEKYFRHFHFCFFFWLHFKTYTYNKISNLHFNSPMWIHTSQ